MRPARLSLYRLSLPFTGGGFLHAGSQRASAGGAKTDNVICELTLDDGTTGYGEAVARKYVTGETSELCWELLSSCTPILRQQFEVTTGEQALEVARACAESIPDREGLVANATRCALELALIDAMFRRLNSSPVPVLAHRLGKPGAPVSPFLAYSMVAGKTELDNDERMQNYKSRYAYKTIKAKVGFGLELDLENLARLRAVFGPGVEVRVDANRSFTYDQAAALLDRLRPLGIRTIEDPLAGDTVAQMGPHLRRLRAQTGCEVVLDEPVRTLQEVEEAIAQDAVDIVSVRIAKCGGLLRSIAIAGRCERAGVAVQVGCQVGETAILSAAGRRFAESVGNLRYLEGSNERLKFLPEHDVCEEDLNYGPDAVGVALSLPGLGLTVIKPRLAQLAHEVLVIDL